MNDTGSTEGKGVLSDSSENFMFFVNGRKIEEANVDPLTSLVDFLRYKLHLTGTKIGCNEGGCGACTVMVSDLHPLTHEIRHYSVNACLTPVAAVFGKAVTTVEGVGCTKKLHSLQERLFQQNAMQCGFCTPGFVMAIYALLCNSPNPTTQEIDESLQGNLCRCTGYRSVLSALYSFARNEEQPGGVKAGCCGMGGQCCMLNGGDCTKSEECCKMVEVKKCSEKCVHQQLIFPPELQVGNYHKSSFHTTFGTHEWFTPTHLEEFRLLKANHTQSKVVSGYSELGVDYRFLSVDIPIAVFSKQVPELYKHVLDEEKGIFVGAALSLNDTAKILKKYCLDLPEWKCSVFRAVIQMLHWFSGTHIRNVATIAGNLATATPVSDLNPIWMASEASVVLSSLARGVRTVIIDEKFFTGYRQTTIENDEIVEGVWIPLSKKNQYFKAFKQSQRREDDITIVSGAFTATIDPENDVVQEIRIAYSGMDVMSRLSRRASTVMGRQWDQSLLDEMLNLIVEEFAISAGAPGGMERYRISLAQSFFLKFFIYVSSCLQKTDEMCYIDEKSTDAAVPLKGTQVFEVSPVDRPVGDAVCHCSGLKYATGEADYCDDINVDGALHMAFVLAPIACGSLDSVDPSDALKMTGVYGYIDHSDIREGITCGGLVPGTGHVVFPKNQIEYYCQPIAAIFADSHERARQAAAAVKVQCTPQKPIVSVKDAIAANSFLKPKPLVMHTSLAAKEEKTAEFDWSRCSHVVEGTVCTGSQEHFYMETQNVVALPHEDNELEIYCGTQCVSIVQRDVAQAVGIPLNKVVVKVKRIGGGFGGKDCCETHAVPAAIAALKFRRPIKYSANRFDDMAIYGNRHASMCNYKAAVSEDGDLQNLEMHLYFNCGYTFGFSFGVIERALVHCNNCYRWQNVDVYGYPCKTNLASNTAFRGFGGPQAMLAAETILVHIAETFNLDVNELRRKNFYSDGDCTFFGMPLAECNARRCWDECLQMSDYEERKKAVLQYNKSHKFSKKGIYIVPTQFNIAFGVKHMNQAGALVNVYTDGSVLISHAGMEMGQGLHTKMIQVAARTLNIDMSLVNITETSTDKVPNTSPTAASSGSDLNGRAVIDACKQINSRLEPIRKELPHASWEQIVRAAYMRRISLSACGFGQFDVSEADFENGRGANMFAYSVYGAGCSEVVVDCLTGDHRLLRTDIAMDLGRSLNPAVDIGQIEGAFLQGYGLYTMEEIKIQPDGVRLTRGPSTYKIPAADDAPREFNVKLLADSSNKDGVFSAKAAGEPPIFLGASAFFAVRDAIRSYRSDRGLSGYFRFDAPATPERIRMAFEDDITERAPHMPPDGDYTPWTVTL